jgi:hypothetical protein
MIICDVLSVSSVATPFHNICIFLSALGAFYFILVP